jgi:hypothetical protein
MGFVQRAKRRIRTPSFIIYTVVIVTVLVVLYFVSVVAMGLVIIGLVGGLGLLAVPAGTNTVSRWVKDIGDREPPRQQGS